MQRKRNYLKQTRTKKVAALKSHDFTPAKLLESPKIASDIGNDEFISFEFREKRLNIVFKAIYVFAIFFAALFINLADGFYSGVDFTYAATACFTAFFVVMLWHMVTYIFHEMECLKTSKDITPKRRKSAEHSYSKLFNACISSIVTAIVSIAVTQLVPSYSTNELAWCFVIPLLWLSSSPLFSAKEDPISRAINNFVNPAMLTLSFSALFLASGLPPIS